MEAKFYFWRTTQQQEIDLIEESEEGLKAFEFKSNQKAKVHIPTTFKDNYPEVGVHIISPENMENIITGQAVS